VDCTFGLCRKYIHTYNIQHLPREANEAPRDLDRSHGVLVIPASSEHLSFSSRGSPVISSASLPGAKNNSTHVRSTCFGHRPQATAKQMDYGYSAPALLSVHISLSCRRHRRLLQSNSSGASYVSATTVFFASYGHLRRSVSA